MLPEMSKFTKISLVGMLYPLPRVTFGLYPLLALLSAGLTGVVAFGFYSLATKNDVMIDHHSLVPPWERSMDSTTPKLLNLHSIPKMSPEIRNLKEEMNRDMV